VAFELHYANSNRVPAFAGVFDEILDGAFAELFQIS